MSEKRHTIKEIIIIIIEKKITQLQQRNKESGSDKGQKFISFGEEMGEKEEERNK